MHNATFSESGDITRGREEEEWKQSRNPFDGHYRMRACEVREYRQLLETSNYGGNKLGYKFTYFVQFYLAVPSHQDTGVA